jgi:hypothetical protein
MQKKALIGVSIFAVVLLVLCSLVNVVGYQSVESAGVSESPLFRIRTQKATNQQQNVLISRYLGEGQGNLLQFPIRNNRTELLKKTIEYISKMDDKTFSQFAALCIQRAKQDKILHDKTSDEIMQVLYLLRTNPEIISNSLVNGNNFTITLAGYYSVCPWFPGCIAAYILIILITEIYTLIILMIMLSPKLSALLSCQFTCQVGYRTFCSDTRCIDAQNIDYSLEE